MICATLNRRAIRTRSSFRIKPLNRKGPSGVAQVHHNRAAIGQVHQILAVRIGQAESGRGKITPGDRLCEIQSLCKLQCVSHLPTDGVPFRVRCGG